MLYGVDDNELNVETEKLEILFFKLILFDKIMKLLQCCYSDICRLSLLLLLLLTMTR